MIINILEVTISIFLGLLDWIKGTLLDIFFLIFAASVTVMMVAFAYNFTLDMIK